MRPFRFSLQRVLDVKTILEKQQRLRVAQANRSAMEAERRLHEAEALRAAAVAEGNDSVLAVSPLMRAMDWRRRARLLRRVQEERDRLAAAKDKLAEERDILIDRNKERRSLELLSQGQKERHTAEENRRGQNVADDLFSGRLVRQSGRDRRE